MQKKLNNNKTILKQELNSKMIEEIGRQEVEAGTERTKGKVTKTIMIGQKGNHIKSILIIMVINKEEINTSIQRRKYVNGKRGKAILSINMKQSKM